MAEVYVSNVFGKQVHQGGFVTSLANVDSWKTEEQLSLPILRDRCELTIQNIGVASGGEHTDAAHTLDYFIYNKVEGFSAPAVGTFGSLFKLSAKTVPISKNERVAYRSNIENGVCNIIQKGE